MTTPSTRARLVALREGIARLRDEADLVMLANRLAGVVFDEIERQGRVLVRAQLADAIHAALLRAGIARDQHRPPIS
jgi:hypothetical protein